MKVSIIVPCYNSEKYLIESLESLEKQVFAEFEVICVNDGSTDNTALVLEKFKSRTNMDLTIISTPNNGVSSARNTGIFVSKGDYLCFLDADDVYSPFFISSLYHSLIDSCSDTAYCKITRKQSDIQNKSQNNHFILKNNEEVMYDLLNNMGEIGLCSFMFKRSIIQDNNLLFTIGLARFEDREFNWKYLCHSSKISFVSQKLYFYRINKDSVTHTICWNIDSIETLNKLIPYVSNYSKIYGKKLNDELYPRLIWSKLKYYSFGGRRDYFRKFLKTFPNTKNELIKLTHIIDSKAIKVTIVLFRIHPYLFYYCIKIAHFFFNRQS